jgi:hypothetical protein
MATGWICARCAAQNDETAFACQTCGLIRGGDVPAPTAPPPVSSADPSFAPPPASAADVTSAPPPPSSWHEAGAAVPPPVPGAPAPGGWPGAPVAIQPTSAKKQVATGILANVGVRIVLLLIVAGVLGGIAWFTNAGRDANGNINKAGDMQPSDLKIGDCWDLPGGGSSFDPNATIEKTTALLCTQAHHYEVFYTGTMTDKGSYPVDDDFKSFAIATCEPAFKTYVGTAFNDSSLTFYYFYPDTVAWKSGNHDFQCSLADADLKPISKSLKGSGY